MRFGLRHILGVLYVCAKIVPFGVAFVLCGCFFVFRMICIFCLLCVVLVEKRLVCMKNGFFCCICYVV